MFKGTFVDSPKLKDAEVSRPIVHILYGKDEQSSHYSRVQNLHVDNQHLQFIAGQFSITLLHFSDVLR